MAGKKKENFLSQEYQNDRCMVYFSLMDPDFVGCARGFFRQVWQLFTQYSFRSISHTELNKKSTECYIVN
jgi:hypothetical protein